MMALALALFEDPQIKLALKFHGFVQKKNSAFLERAARTDKPPNVFASHDFYIDFFKLVGEPETPFLLTCLLESSFADVRKGAFTAMNLGQENKASGVPISEIGKKLGYDDRPKRNVNRPSVGKGTALQKGKEEKGTKLGSFLLLHGS